MWARVGSIWDADRRTPLDAKLGRLDTLLFHKALGSYAAKVGVICVFLAAYSIPVTFDSVMSVIGSSSAANMASVTPGAVGVTQAANVAALRDYHLARTRYLAATGATAAPVKGK